MSIHPQDAPPPAMPYNSDPAAIFGTAQTLSFNSAPTVLPGGQGLDILRDCKKVLLHQQLDAIEAVTFIDRPNKYLLLNKDEQVLMMLEEENSGYFQRHRAIDVIARDATGQKLFHVTRPSKPCSLCGFCCAFMKPCKYEGDVSLHDQDGRHLGHLIQRVSFSSAKLEVEDKDEHTIYKIKGGNACCVPATEYKIENRDDKEVGEIEKQGMAMGMGENKYKIKFPDDASPEAKALIIGVAILMDYRFHFNARMPPQRRRRR